MAKLEFFFDCSSPWTYLAFTRIHDIIKRTKAEVSWRPILVGGIFNAVNKDVYERRANPDLRKAAYSAKDLQDWARLAGIHIVMPPPVFPVRAILPMRACIAAQEQGAVIPYAKACFETYWSDLKDISQPDVVREICAKAGLDGDAILARADSGEVKDQLRLNTEEVIARGGFGSPTMYVNGNDMFFGNDRLPLVEAALMR